MTGTDDDSILRYVRGEASEEEVLAFDRRMATDPALLERVRRLMYLRSRFDDVFLGLTASAYGERRRAVALAEALVAVAQSQPEWKSLLQKWFRQFGESAASSYRVLLDQAKRISSVACDQPSPGLTAELALGFGGVGSTDRELENHLREGAIRLERGDVLAAREALESAARLDTRQTQTAHLRLSRGATAVCEVRVNSVRGTVAVKNWTVPGRTPPAFAILVPDGSPTDCRAAAFEFLRDEGAHLAEFSAVRDGSCRLFILE